MEMPEIEDAEATEVSLVDWPANKRSTLEIAKRANPAATEAEVKRRYEKRMAKAQGKFFADMARVKAGKPIEKKKRKKVLPLEVEEHDPTGAASQPERIGPQVNETFKPTAKGIQKQVKAMEKQIGQVIPDPKPMDGRRSPDTEFERNRAAMFASSALKFEKCLRGEVPLFPDGRPSAPEPSPAYKRMMKRAEELVWADPSKTVEQHFTDLFTNPAFAALAKADRSHVLKGKGVDAPPNSALTDDDEVSPGESSGYADDSDEKDDMDLRDDRGEPPASAASAGASRAQYAMTGENTMMHPQPAAGGRNSGSYSDRKRSASNTRRSR
jgi:hypothetical protein